MIKRRLLLGVALVATCLMLGYLDGLRSYLTSYHDGQFWLERSIAIWWDVIGWSSWIFLAPLTIHLSRRFRPDDNRLRNIFILLSAGLVFSFIRTFFAGVFYSLIFDLYSLSYVITNKPFFHITDFLIALFVYSLIITIENALNYYKQYRESELRKSQLEAQLAQAELQALKMQLNPHFLFNALNSISALQLEDVKAAQKMIARLGDFLRMTLENAGTQEEVTLKQEMEFLKCYLEIERTRFSNRLTTEIKLEPDTLDALVPNLILQPIVENAIRHGIANKISQGQITISTNRDNGSLHIEVKDNGQGLKTNGNGTNDFQEGIGLSNTRARLMQHYGANYDFNLENAAEGGLIVKMDIPFKTRLNN